MPYADSDFFLALIKPEDRLGKEAVEIYHRFKGRIYTSIATIIELSLVAVKQSIPVEELIVNVLRIAKVEEVETSKILFAVHLITYEKFSVFDAFHASLCEGEIISSNHIYDGINLKRIKL
ncbi:MAG: PIN domain-containing protein [Candidatus Micrarchaeota archaeon]|nr:PIN domain-containing protein [Candidatus Micrarchaeota archaeon]